MSKKLIYLADLTHTKNGIMALTFPLGTAYVTTYAKQTLSDNFDFMLFKFPEVLAESINTNPPRVLALSNYSWNVELGCKLSSWAKKHNPELVVVFGGPNFPTSKKEKIEFLQTRSNIDFYIENEGEVGFSSLISRLHEYDFNVEKFKKSRELVTNCTYIVEDELIEGGINRIKDVNIINSPYLEGDMDKFFNYPLSPMIETHRGCPFSCTFCADGLSSKSKVTSFTLDRVKDEVCYIANRISNIDEMYITDLNFGMYKKDVETAKIIAEVQDKLNWPHIIRATTGKNKTDRVIETAKILKGSWITGPAIQTSDKEVLKNVKRSNISVDAYRKISEFMKSLDSTALTFTELILGLPGDTKEKHFDSLKYAIDSRMTKLKTFQAMLLVGTEMASPETRNKFGLVGKFRITAGGVGVYKFDDYEIPIAEVHEIIISSNDMTFEEHISCRIMHLLLEAYHNQCQFEEIFYSLSELGISEFDFLTYLHDHDELYTPGVNEIIESYTRAIRENLYDSYEEAEAAAINPNNVGKYTSGELGFNELLICNAQMYFVMNETLSILLVALENYLKDKNIFSEHIMDYFSQLGRFILCKKKEITNPDSVIEEYFDYDFEEFSSVNYKIDPRDVSKTREPVCFRFFHDSEQKTLINNSVGLYENHTDGIARMLYSNNLQKLYRNFYRISS